MGLRIFMVNSLLPLFLCDFCSLCSVRPSHPCVVPAGSPTAHSCCLPVPPCSAPGGGGGGAEAPSPGQGLTGRWVGWQGRVTEMGGCRDRGTRRHCACCMGFCGSISSFVCLQGSAVAVALGVASLLVQIGIFY